jgi:uncharacterized repeat protein (TIGR04076 family)
MTRNFLIENKSKGGYMAKVKITVVKKVNNKDLFGDNPPLDSTSAPECERFELAQEFISKGDCPEGFCAWAFADIQRDITHLRLGGDFPWMKQRGTSLSCCTDGVRPVIFKLERIEE